MKALEMKDVKFKHRGSDRWALGGVNLDVEQGEFVTILGANGSGKSTICLLSNGLIPHAIPGDLEGTVEVFGKDVSKSSVADLSTKVGVVFQEPESQLFCMSVEEEIAFGPENLAVPRDEIKRRIEWALDLVDLRGFNDRSPFNLSGGQKQRVAIAAALAMKPDMLLLDEPAYALDPVGRIELYSVLRSLKEKHGLTVVLAERDAEDAAAFSDRIVLMKNGTVVKSGLPREVLRDPETLRSSGVAPPQLTELASLMNSRLHKSDLSFLNVDEAELAIVRDILNQRGVRRP